MQSVWTAAWQWRLAAAGGVAVAAEIVGGANPGEKRDMGREVA